ncbi:unnamed protein product [Meloidogyne enterolobii]|uniref:Uncharacterized protein n=1 Tax=Meloidogyne enterolobii TaxID=390850 RepID=A0ACB1AVQ9_MELEN
MERERERERTRFFKKYFLHKSLAFHINSAFFISLIRAFLIYIIWAFYNLAFLIFLVIWAFYNLFS